MRECTMHRLRSGPRCVPPARPSRSKGYRRPVLEVLEDRTLLDGGLHPALVQQLYRDLLGRDADPGGLSSWTGLLDGGLRREAVVLGIEDSLEYRTQQVD